MAALTQISDDAAAGLALSHEAKEWREGARWRLRRDDPERQAHIAQLLDAIDDAMKPIRSHIGRLVHDPIPDAPERALREASAALQYERRQLKKMR